MDEAMGAIYDWMRASTKSGVRSFQMSSNLTPMLRITLTEVRDGGIELKATREVAENQMVDAVASMIAEIAAAVRQ